MNAPLSVPIGNCRQLEFLMPEDLPAAGFSLPLEWNWFSAVDSGCRKKRSVPQIEARLTFFVGLEFGCAADK